jgi:hypothetical protein
MRFPRGISRFGSAPKGRGSRSTSGLRTVSATRTPGSFNRTSNGGRNGRREQTVPGCFRLTHSASSIADFQFQRMSFNGF